MGRLLNNGELEFTYIEAKDKYGITASRFTRSIDELVEKGFLDVTNPGGGVHKMKTLYGISERWRAYDTPGFKKIGRPERRFKCGFRRGNDFWKRSKRKSQLSIMHTARALDMRNNTHGSILAMHNNAHGEKVKTQYNFNKGRRLCAQLA